MSDDSLKATLRQLKVPAPNERAMQRACSRAEIAFANRPQLSADPAGMAAGVDRGIGLPWRRRWPLLLAGCAVAAATLTILKLNIGKHGGVSGSLGEEPRRDAALLAEVEKLFPGQLDALVEHGTALSIDLSHSTRHPKLATANSPSQPLEVTLVRDGKSIRIIGYSGRDVTVQINDRQQETFQPLMDGDGNVILVGRDFVWTSKHPSPVGGYQVEARPLTL